MRYFECSVCNQQFEIEGPEDPVKCLSCGHEGKIGEHFTELSPIRIVFQDKNENKIYIHKSEIVGRDTFRLFEDYKYVSSDQFKINKDNEKRWSLVALDNTTNPTFLNGEKLEPGKEVLIDHKKENEILIGNIETGVGLKLKVLFEYL